MFLRGELYEKTLYYVVFPIYVFVYVLIMLPLYEKNLKESVDSLRL